MDLNARIVWFRFHKSLKLYMIAIILLFTTVYDSLSASLVTILNLFLHVFIWSKHEFTNCIGYFGEQLGFIKVTQLSNHIDNPSIRFCVPHNLVIEPNITSVAKILTE